MDPVGSWSAYAFSRLATSSGLQNVSNHPHGPYESHPHTFGTSGVPPQPNSSSSQLLLPTSGAVSSPFNSGFISPNPVGYDGVFTPQFHQKAHYRAAVRDVGEDAAAKENHNMINGYEQGSTWSQNNTQLHHPFGVLPHENVFQNSPPKPYENFNPHFSSSQLNQIKPQSYELMNPNLEGKRIPQPFKQASSNSTPLFFQSFPDANFNYTKNYQNKDYCPPQMHRFQCPQEKRFYPESNYSYERREDESQTSPISFAIPEAQRSYQNPKFGFHTLSYPDQRGRTEAFAAPRQHTNQVYNPQDPSFFKRPILTPLDASLPKQTYSSVPRPRRQDSPREDVQDSYPPLPVPSSCRGDPLSLVKMLQGEEKQKPQDTDYSPRVPPPAHHNSNYSNHYDFERWNLPPPSGKFYQSSVQPTNFTQPYVQSFLPQSDPPSEPAPVEIPQVQQVKEPEIPVPVIEDDLSFLENPPQGTEEEIDAVRPLGPNPNLAFQAAYLKFIEGQDHPLPPEEKRPSLSPETELQPPLPDFPSDPQDDPRYFPLPKTVDERSFESDSSDDDVGFAQLRKLNERIRAEIEEDKKNRKLRKSQKAHRKDEKKGFGIEELRKAEKRKKKAGKTRGKIKTTEEEDKSEIQPSRIPTRSQDRTYADEEKTNEKGLSSPPSSRKDLSSKASLMDNSCPFEVDDFIISSLDRHKLNPFVWRVTRTKRALQKYQHFVRDGVTLYSSLTSYMAWCPQDDPRFKKVEMVILKENGNQTIVQPLSYQLQEPLPRDRIFIDAKLAEFKKYQFNFEIFIQTLFSQALDGTFIEEIIQDKDEYFLSNVKVIDKVNEELRNKLVDLFKWHELSESLIKYPSYKFHGVSEGTKCLCSDMADASIMLTGEPYHSKTLMKLDPPSPNSLEVPLCSKCMEKAELLHKISHQKKAIYAHCKARVLKKKEDSKEDLTILLNKLLADESWLGQFFLEVAYSWAFAEETVAELGKL